MTSKGADEGLGEEELRHDPNEIMKFLIKQIGERSELSAEENIPSFSVRFNKMMDYLLERQWLKPQETIHLSRLHHYISLIFLGKLSVDELLTINPGFISDAQITVRTVIEEFGNGLHDDHHAILVVIEMACEEILALVQSGPNRLRIV